MLERMTYTEMLSRYRNFSGHISSSSNKAILHGTEVRKGGESIILPFWEELVWAGQTLTALPSENTEAGNGFLFVLFACWLGGLE